MPVLSMFYGIVVQMFNERGGKHNKPHIHAKYSGHKAVLSLDGELLEGGLPNAKQKILEAWVLIHQDELQANWDLLSAGEDFFRIDPLR